jgi:hypothetical protein
LSDQGISVLIRVPRLAEAEVCESTGHENAQPTHPERNTQAADFHLPSKDDPQQMHCRHDEKQRGGDYHIGFSVQSACPSAARPTTPDSSLRLITGEPYAVGHVSHPLSTYPLMTYLPFRFRSFRAA